MSRRRKTLWRRTRVKTRARAPSEERVVRPETWSVAAPRPTVNREEWTAANDDAPAEAKAANPVPKAVESAALGQTEMVNPARKAAASDDAGETEAPHRTANGQTAHRERWQAASDDVGEMEALAGRMALAAGNVAPGETGAIRQTANKARLTDLGEPGRAEAAPAAVAMRAVAASVVTGRAGALSPALMARAIAPRHRPRRFRNGSGGSSGCSAPTISRKIA
jgi:hypothetical protein